MALRVPKQIGQWFQERDWRPLAFQKAAWQAYADGNSGLIHSATGSGKTLAVFGGPVIEWVQFHSRHSAVSQRPVPLTVLWITPLRALARDTQNALHQLVSDLQIPWSVELRTSDSTPTQRSRQRTRMPAVLITTPESLSLILSRPDAAVHFQQLKCVVCDEIHELMGSKRGTQVELALARLRQFQPRVRVWGLSATLGNLHEAAAVLSGTSADTFLQQVAIDTSAPAFCLIRGQAGKRPRIRSLIPDSFELFPWAGHTGRVLVDRLVQELEQCPTSLVFTNTRSQTELWYQTILSRRPDWAGNIALHHGSLEFEVRSWVEDQLRAGKLKCVVCTSSLDLGVDFSAVDQVFQIGSPRGIARLLQRAGRSGHRPGQRSEIICLPTHALELLEFAAARDAVHANAMESRHPLRKPLDVLCQHLLTVAAGDGFVSSGLLQEVRQSHAFQALSDEEWDWCIAFLCSGGTALHAYPEYRKLHTDIESGRLHMGSEKQAREHRMCIGTITADCVLLVQYLSGSRIGTIEESFIERMVPGDCFALAGKQLELVRVHEMTVYVKKASPRSRARIPRWMGGKMPLSSELAMAVLEKLRDAADGRFRSPELKALKPLLQKQQALSRIPVPGTLLIEKLRSRDGFHQFYFPFAGRLVHEALAALFAWRLSRNCPATFSISVNDYGFELLSNVEFPANPDVARQLCDTRQLRQDIQACLNASEMSKRRFREIARVSGLVFQGYPGRKKTSRQLQSSSGLLFDVFANYDPQNLLLQQASTEVLEQQFELNRLQATLQRLQTEDVLVTEPAQWTPFSFPLMVERLRERLTSEQLESRVSRMQLQLQNKGG